MRLVPAPVGDTGKQMTALETVSSAVRSDMGIDRDFVTLQP